MHVIETCTRASCHASNYAFARCWMTEFSTAPAVIHCLVPRRKPHVRGVAGLFDDCVGARCPGAVKVAICLAPASCAHRFMST